MNILFLCTANIQRSRTAAEVFRAIDKSNNYKSTGLSKKYVDKAGTNLCSEDGLDWADKNYVFEGLHIERKLTFGVKITSITKLKSLCWLRSVSKSRRNAPVDGEILFK